MPESALVYTLQKVNWQFFSALTFKSERLPEKYRLRMFFALVRQTLDWFSVYWNDALWVLRQEPGEIGGRLHFHFLLYGLPNSVVTYLTCLSIKNSWKGLGGGIAVVREYDASLHGEAYILKCLGAKSGANLYEVGKFSTSPDGVMLSNSIWNPEKLHRVPVGVLPSVRNAPETDVRRTDCN